MKLLTSIIFLVLTTFSFANHPDILYTETNHYAFGKVLGKGAYGQVYSVKDKDDQPFAIKMLHLPGDTSGFFMNDAAREFSIGQALDHPNILKTYDLVIEKNENGEYQTFMIMELIKGFTVGDAEQISYSNARKAIRQLIDAIRYAKSHGYFHIDLHEYNIMIETTTGNLKIVDLASFVTLKEINITTGSTIKEKGVSLPIAQHKIEQFFARHLQPVKQKKVDQSQNVDELGFYYVYFRMIVNNVNCLVEASDLPRREKEALNLQTIYLLLPYNEDQTNFSFEENLDLLELIFLD